MKISAIKSNPNNPRIIKDDKFEKLCNSIKDMPAMMELRPIVINDDNVILGGNMRFKALQHLGYKDIPDEWVKTASKLTDEQKRKFIILDNVSGGEWDWEMLANEWDTKELADWGLDLPVYDTSEAELPALRDSESEIVQITITVSREMEDIIKTAIAKCKQEGQSFEDGLCENENGKALTGICKNYVR